jgi:hypothetical protein
MAKFKVASEEGAQRYGGEIGDIVDLSLGSDEERAVIAAGWLEDVKTPKEAKN